MFNSIKGLAVFAWVAIFLNACNEGGFNDDSSALNPDVFGNHESTVFVKAVSLEIVEGESVRFTIGRHMESPPDEITINISVDSANPYRTYTFTDPESFTLGQGKYQDQLVLRTIDDRIWGVEGYVSLRILPGDGYKADVNGSSAIVGVRNTGSPPLEISVVPDSEGVVEGETATFTIKASRHSVFNREVTLAVSPSETNLILGANTHTTVIPAFEISASFVIRTVNRNRLFSNSPAATIEVSVQPGEGYSGSDVARINVYGTLREGVDEDVLPEISISAVSDSVIEGYPARFTVSSSKDASSNIVIRYTVVQTGNVLEEIRDGGTDILPPIFRSPTFDETTQTNSVNGEDRTVILPLVSKSATFEVGTQVNDVNGEGGTVTVRLADDNLHPARYTVTAVKSDSIAEVAVSDGDPLPALSIAAVEEEVVEGLPAQFSITTQITASSEALAVHYTVVQTGNVLEDTTVDRTVVLAGYDKTITFDVATDDDDVAETGGVITATLAMGSNGQSKYTITNFAIDQSANVQVVDNDPLPVISISSVAPTVVEGLPAQFSVSTPTPFAEDIIVRYVVVQTGNVLEDATVDRAVLLAGYDRTITFDVATDDDDVAETGGVITATLEIKKYSQPNYTITTLAIGQSANVQVVDNDPLPVYSVAPTVVVDSIMSMTASGGYAHPLAFIFADSDEIEEGGSASFTVSLSGNTTTALEINVSWTVEGSFLTAGSRILTIQNGGREASLDLGLTAENIIPEPDGSVTATLGIGTGYQVNSRENSDTIAILDNDATPEPSRSGALHQEVLTNLLDGTSERSVDRVSDRVGFAFSNSGKIKFELNGANTINDFVTSSGRKVNEEGVDLNSLLSGSSFTLPLLPDGNAATPVTLWGNGFNRSISDREEDSSINWEGESFTGNLGLDARFDEGLLVGVVSATDDSSVNFTHEDSEGKLSGSYSVRMTSIQPYLAWASGDLNTQLRGSFGYGIGEVGIDYDHYDPESAGSRRYSVSIGGSDLLYSSDSLFDGTLSELTVEAEAWMSRQSVTGNGLSIVGTAVDTRRLRIVAEGSLQTNFDTGSTFSPAVLVGTRWYGGEGNTGLGIEMTGRADYQNPAGFKISGLGRMLVSNLHSKGEKGLKGELSYDPEHDGIGVFTTLSPALGALNDTGIQQFWDDGVVENGAFQANGGARLETEIGYGFSILDGGALLAPYLKAEFFERSGNRYGIGTRFNHVSGMGFEFEGTHEPYLNGGSDRKVKLQGSIKW